EMQGGNEKPFACDGDIGRGGRARLPLTGKWNDPRLVERLRGQDRIPADRPAVAAKRQEKREEVTRRCDGAKRLVVPLDILLQQHDVITRRAACQPTGCEIVYKARKLAFPRVHVPRGDGECDRCRSRRWRNDVRPYAGGRNEDGPDQRGADPSGARGEPERPAPHIDLGYIAVAVFARAAAASLAADRSIVVDV